MKKKSIEEKLLKPYSKRAMKIRRLIFNLFRPVLHDKSTSIWNQHMMAYLMFGSFTVSFCLLLLDIPYHSIPFSVMFTIIPITWIYFKFQPQTWVEMYEYEKDAFRHIWKLPKDWKPTPPWIGSEGTGKKHSTK
tara:strand:+ start:111 stop:512 length:402 start_codon:yes stop_codon:yes gene_type:complete